MADDALSRLWAQAKDWFRANASQYTYEPIPPERTDVAVPGAPLKPMASYFRIWLSDMFLTNSRDWFKSWYPAVNATVQLKFGTDEGVKFTRVARPGADVLGSGVQLNYRLTELMPYNGGVVEVDAALLALKGEDSLSTAIGILQGFSDLVGPPLAQALPIVDRVAAGVQALFGAADGNIHLVLHQSLIGDGGGGASVLKPGYTAVILAPTGQIARERLSVRNDRLHYAARPGGEPVPLTGYDYMLLRVEGRAERDDWRLRNIEQPLNQAIAALAQGDAARAEAFKKSIAAEVFQSPDLAVNDRRRVWQAIVDELGAIPGGLGAVGVERRDLAAIVEARAMSPAAAAALGEMTLAEALAA